MMTHYGTVHCSSRMDMKRAEHTLHHHLHETEISSRTKQMPQPTYCTIHSSIYHLDVLGSEKHLMLFLSEKAFSLSL